MQLFHIGFHKTGTTWFQNNFYPDLENFDYLPQEYVKNHIVNPYRLASAPNILGDVCVCDEELLGNIHLGSVGGAQAYSNIKRIREVSREPRIVLFVRNQVDLLYSCYLQYVKKGGSLTFFEYINQDKKAANRLPVFDMEHFKFSRLYKFLIEVFDEKSVYLYFYEDFLVSTLKFIDGFSNDHGFVLKGEPRVEVKSNLSYNRSQLEIMRLLNKLTCGDVYKNDNVVNLGRLIKLLGKGVVPLLRIDNKKAQPNESIAGYIRDYYRKDNEALSSFFSLPDSYF